MALFFSPDYLRILFNALGAKSSLGVSLPRPYHCREVRCTAPILNVPKDMAGMALVYSTNVLQGYRLLGIGLAYGEFLRRAPSHRTRHLVTIDRYTDLSLTMRER